MFQFTFQQPNTSSLVSIKCLIKFTNLSLFASDCFATCRLCVVHCAVHGVQTKHLYTGSSHNGVDDSSLLGYDTMQGVTRFHTPEDKKFYNF